MGDFATPSVKEFLTVGNAIPDKVTGYIKKMGIYSMVALAYRELA